MPCPVFTLPRRVWRKTVCAAGPRCSPPGTVLSRAHIYGYGRSLRPPQGTSIAPRRRAVFRQTLLDTTRGCMRAILIALHPRQLPCSYAPKAQSRTGSEMHIFVGRNETASPKLTGGFGPSCQGTVAPPRSREGVGEMVDINRFSEQVIDLAERLADMSDAAKGKGGRRRSLGPQWVVLPAAGAGLYALATSGSFTRQAKGVMNQAKARASELPDDLLSRIRQTSQTSSSGNSRQRRRQSSTRRKTNAAKTSSGR
jgi:hypothetical protein